METPLRDGWQAALFARRNVGMKFGLAELGAVDRALGCPGAELECVQVLGTNGKGSTAAMLAHLLERSGRRVGLFTSPHLHRVGERMRIDGRAASDEEVQAAVGRVLASERAAGRPLSFFELLTLAAWVHFDAAGVDVVVLEAGLGGRLDATSLRSSTLALLAAVGLDHQEFLGDSLGAIAAEKVGALRPGQVCLHSPQAPAVQAALERRRDEGVHFVELAPLAHAPLAGDHQRANAALAWGAALMLGAVTPAANARALFDGFRWPGRAEGVVQHAGELVFDVAHNPQAIAACTETWAAGHRPRPDLALFGAATGKAAATMARQLAASGLELWWVSPQGPRAGPVDPEVRALCTRVFERCDDPQLHEAVERRTRAGERVWMGGSHFLVAPMRAWALGLDPLDMDPPELTDPVTPS